MWGDNVAKDEKRAENAEKNEFQLLTAINTRYLLPIKKALRVLEQNGIPDKLTKMNWRPKIKLMVQMSDVIIRNLHNTINNIGETTYTEGLKKNLSRWETLKPVFRDWEGGVVHGDVESCFRDLKTAMDDVRNDVNQLDKHVAARLQAIQDSQFGEVAALRR
jgi:hypothetical protein